MLGLKDCATTPSLFACFPGIDFVTWSPYPHFCRAVVTGGVTTPTFLFPFTFLESHPAHQVAQECGGWRLWQQEDWCWATGCSSGVPAIQGELPLLKARGPGKLLVLALYSSFGSRDILVDVDAVFSHSPFLSPSHFLVLFFLCICVCMCMCLWVYMPVCSPEVQYGPHSSVVYCFSVYFIVWDKQDLTV